MKSSKTKSNKIYKFNIRLDEKNYEKLVNYCLENNLAKAEVARLALIEILDEKEENLLLL